MGIIAKQASSNAALTLTGTVFGAINTIIVLPLAFAEFKSGWGVLRFVLSWAFIFSQLFSFGANSIVINYLPKFDSIKEKSQLMRYVLILSLVGIGILMVFAVVGTEFFLSKVPIEDRALTAEHIPHMLVLTCSLILAYVFSAFSIAGLRTTRYILLNEPFLKGTYLLLGILYLYDIISFEVLMWSFVGSYAFVAFAFYVGGRSDGMRFESGLAEKNRKGALQYGIYSILDKGAQNITQNLDIIMIGFLLDMETVAEYIIAFFIGGVVLIPFGSINTIAAPIVSKAIASNDSITISKTNKDTAFFAIFLGGFIFACVGSNIFDIFSHLPDKFAGGEYVALFIGISRLFSSISGMSGAIILYSSYYRVNLIFNLGLIILTILTNLTLIPEFGVTGAAMATALSSGVFSLGRMIFVHYRFRTSPLSMPLLMTITVTIITILVLWKTDVGPDPIASIFLKGLICMIIFGMLLLLTGRWREVLDLWKSKIVGAIDSKDRTHDS